MADFSEAQFNGDAGFSKAQFKGDAIFSYAQFSEDAYFSEAQFSGKLNLKMVKYDQLLIHWEDIKEHLEYDGATYLTLIKNFRNLERFDDADDCYYEYRKLSQKGKEWNWSKLLDWIAFISCGYGVRLRFVIVWMIGLIILFGIINLLSGNPASESL